MLFKCCGWWSPWPKRQDSFPELDILIINCFSEVQFSSVPSDCFHLIHQFFYKIYVIFVLCSLFLLISVIVDLGLKKIMSIIFSVMIKDWMFTCKCYGRDDAIASWGKRQKNEKCWSKVWLWYNIIWKWKLLSHIQLFGTPWTVACQAPLSMEFSRSVYWSG